MTAEYRFDETATVVRYITCFFYVEMRIEVPLNIYHPALSDLSFRCAEFLLEQLRIIHHRGKRSDDRLVRPEKVKERDRHDDDHSCYHTQHKQKDVGRRHQ